MKTRASTYNIVDALYKGVSVVHVTVGAEHKLYSIKNICCNLSKKKSNNNTHGNIPIIIIFNYFK